MKLKIIYLIYYKNNHLHFGEIIPLGSKIEIRDLKIADKFKINILFKISDSNGKLKWRKEKEIEIPALENTSV